MMFLGVLMAFLYYIHTIVCSDEQEIDVWWGH